MLGGDPLRRPEPLIQSVYSYVAYRVGDRADAEDITNDAFERALRFRDTYDRKKGTPQAWLLRGSANLCRRALWAAGSRRRVRTGPGNRSRPRRRRGSTGDDPIRDRSTRRPRPRADHAPLRRGPEGAGDRRAPRGHGRIRSRSRSTGRSNGSARISPRRPPRASRAFSCCKETAAPEVFGLSAERALEAPRRTPLGVSLSRSPRPGRTGRGPCRSCVLRLST